MDVLNVKVSKCRGDKKKADTIYPIKKGDTIYAMKRNPMKFIVSK